MLISQIQVNRIVFAVENIFNDTIAQETISALADTLKRLGELEAKELEINKQQQEQERPQKDQPKSKK